MSTTNRIVGIILLIFLGFLFFVLLTGLGFLIGFMFHVLSLWQIVVGTLLGSIAVFVYLMGNSK